MIEKITDQNLERYDSRLKEWCDRKFFEKGDYGKYETTEESKIVTFYPAPDIPLEGKVKFSFKETMPAEGVKGPDNSSTITGVSNITVTHCESESIDSTDYTISLDNTYYGGEIDLVTGVMMVTWAGDILSASNFSIVGTSQSVVTNMVFITSKAHGGGSTTSPAVLTCNRFLTVSGTGDIEHVRFSGAGSSTSLNVYIDRSRLDLSDAVDPVNPTAAELKSAMIAWLSVNQTLVVYQISEPFTVQLTPIQIFSLSQSDKYTPRLNTVYTNADSIQVSYLKSPIRDEYEKTQAILSLGGNS